MEIRQFGIHRKHRDGDGDGERERESNKKLKFKIMLCTYTVLYKHLLYKPLKSC